MPNDSEGLQVRSRQSRQDPRWRHGTAILARLRCDEGAVPVSRRLRRWTVAHGDRRLRTTRGAGGGQPETSKTATPR